MAKYGLALCLLSAMVITITVINARSTGPTSAPRPAADSPRATGSIYATGIVEGATQDIQLRAEQNGRVTKVFVSAGGWVKAGDELIRLDSARQRQEVALAEASVELAQAELERLKNGARTEERDEAHALRRAAQVRLDQATRTWARVEQLRSDRAVSQQEADDQQASADALRGELEAAEARVRQIEAPAREDEIRAAAARVASAKAQLELAHIGVSKTELRAPQAGRVLDVNVEPGELTGPDAAQPLVVLSDTSSLRVRAYVEELDAPRVAAGMTANVMADGLPGTTFVGRVVAISPRMETKSIHADRPFELYDSKVREVLVELEGAEQLIVGLRVDASFEAADGATIGDGIQPLANRDGPASD